MALNWWMQAVCSFMMPYKPGCIGELTIRGLIHPNSVRILKGEICPQERTESTAVIHKPGDSSGTSPRRVKTQTRGPLPLQPVKLKSGVWCFIQKFLRWFWRVASWGVQNLKRREDNARKQQPGLSEGCEERVWCTTLSLAHGCLSLCFCIRHLPSLKIALSKRSLL